MKIIINMRNRLTIFIGCGFLVFMLGAAHLFVQYLISLEISAVKSRQVEFLDIISNSATEEIKFSRKYLSFFLKQFSPGDFNTRESIKRKFDRVLNERLALRVDSIFNLHFLILDNSGKISAFCEHLPVVMGTDLSDRNFFKQVLSLKKQLMFSGCRDHMLYESSSLLIAEPYIDDRGLVRGYVCGIMMLSRDTLMGKIAKYSFSSRGYLYIINSERELIVHPEFERLGTIVPAGKNLLLDRAVDEGFEGSGETVNSRGVEMITSFKKIPGTDLIVAANYYRKLIDSGIYDTHGSLYFIVAAGALFFFGILSVLLRRSFSPLYSLVDKLEEMKNTGSINTVKPEGSGEVRKLYSSFNSMAEKLNFSHEHIIKLYEVKSRYLAKMSHEIRTPMNAIIGMTDLAMITDNDFERLDYLTTVKKSSDHLMGVVNDILDYSKIEAGAMELYPVPFYPLEEIKGVMNIMSHKCAEKNLEINIEVENCEDNCAVSGDSQRFRQVLFNIIGNAVKFTERGIISVRVRGERQPSGEDQAETARLLIEVEDTGPGIPPERIDLIFESFTQADPAVSIKYGGTGLGLTISREIVQRMGGSIKVKSQLGMGSVFTVDLMFPISEEGPGVHSSCRSSVVDRPLSMKSYSLLVAEDNPVNVKLIETVLKKQGHSVSVAGNGLEAISLLAEKKFDAVLMDIEMPVMDGLEAVRRIRAGEAGEGNASIPVVAMTAHAFSEMRELCREAGMNSYVTKPIKIEEINSMLTELIEKSQ